MKNDIEWAEKTLKYFISAMNEWELSSYPLLIDDSSEQIKTIVRNRLDDIFSRYCTLKDRKQGRQVSLSCSEPPGYSMDEDFINIELIKNKAIIYTKQNTGFKNKYRYTLQFNNNEWRIDKKERFSPFEEKWIKDNL
ncbi:NTF2 fold immunity protein [Yersinia similis]|uniref:NTF2 fold immunity protein n=1 Tax=Yersinia similis TaxID=367190 RepID=UPI0005E1D35C|nr:NTF2 fold immunity protein [Yersinia similis]CNC61927.1 Uncharacterised protein [Yersinia similis]CNF71801.1 Uncharacterised protein [Yersinia similis]